MNQLVSGLSRMAVLLVVLTLAAWSPAAAKPASSPTGQAEEGVSGSVSEDALAPGTLLARGTMTLESSGKVALREKRVGEKDDVYEVCVDPSGKALDLPALLAEEALAWEPWGRTSPALAVEVAGLSLDSPVPVLVWSDAALPIVEKELVAAGDPVGFEQLDAAEIAAADARAELMGLLASFGIEAEELAWIPAVRAMVPAGLIPEIANAPGIGRVGLGWQGLIPTKATFGQTVGADIVHGLGFTGDGEVIGIVLPDRPSSQACLGQAVVRGLAPTVSEEATVAAGVLASDLGEECTPEADGGIAPDAGLRISDTEVDQGCDGVCWAIAQGAEVVGIGWAAASSLPDDAVLNEYDAYLDSLVKTYPYPLFVASAGNSNLEDGTPCGTAPNWGYVQNHLLSGLVVGGIDESSTERREDDTFYYCSSWKNPQSPHGDRELPHLVAPAANVQAAGAGPSDGTSMAAGIVAGVAALVRDGNPSLRFWPEPLRAILLVSGSGDVDRNFGFDCPSESTGCGRDGTGTVWAPEAVAVGSGENRIYGSPGEPARERGHDFGTMVFGTDFPNGFFHRGGQPVQWKFVVAPGATVRVALTWDSTAVVGPRFQDLIDADLDLYVYNAQGQFVGGSFSWDRAEEVALIHNSGSAAAEYYAAARLWTVNSASTYFGLAFGVVDLGAPRLTLLTPVHAHHTTGQPHYMRPTPDGRIVVRGRIDDENDLVYGRVWVDDQYQTIRTPGDFEATFSWEQEGGPFYVEHVISVVAEDVLGNVSWLSALVRIVSEEQGPPSVTVRMSPGVPPEEVEELAAMVDGHVVGSNARSGTFRIGLPQGADPDVATSTLRSQDNVLFAVVDAWPRPDLPLDYPDDPNYNQFYSATWYLYQKGDVRHYRHGSFTDGGSGCGPFPGGQCLMGQTCDIQPGQGSGKCVCSANDQCTADTVCVTSGTADLIFDGEDECPNPKTNLGNCVACGYEDADIDWHQVLDGIYEAQTAGPEVRVAVVETDGLVAWKHDDLRKRIWTNTLECCGSNENCLDQNPADDLPDCVAGESLPDWLPLPPPCSPPNCHCQFEHPILGLINIKPLSIPEHSRCVKVEGDAALYYIGKVCSSSVDCGYSPGKCDHGICIDGPVGEKCATDTDCDKWPGVCVKMGPFELCTGGYPGLPAVDDDGDGFADFEDPDVQHLIFGMGSGLLVNGVDDDFSCPGGIPANPQDPCIDNPEEILLAAFDDDEDGVLDDIHGADFQLVGLRPNVDPPILGAWFGHLWATTHDEFAARHGGGHATAVAGILGAEVHNGEGMPGVTPAARFVTMTYDAFENAMEYAALVRCDVVNLSSGLFLQKGNKSDEDFLADLMNHNKYFHNAADPNALYVFSAGNNRFDLDSAPDPYSGVIGPGDATRWRFPQNVKPKRGIVVGASDFKDRFADWFFGCDAWTWANFPKLCDSNYDPAQPDLDWETGSAFGSETVDLAAPGTHIFSLAWAKLAQVPLGISWSGVHWGSGTSASAPVVSGAGALLMSLLPDQYLHRPLAVIARLKQTVETNASDGTASYVGKTDALGRIDLLNALDDVNFPLPPQPAFENVTWLLPDWAADGTHGAALWRQATVTDPETGVTEPRDLLFRVYGGRGAQGLVDRKPSLHVARPGEHFENRTATLPNVPGFYSSVAAGDLTGDGCNDLVLAAHLQEDPDPEPWQVIPFMGGKSVVLFQESALFGQERKCLGTFMVAPDALVGDLTVPELLNRNVALADFDLDGDLDVLIPAAAYQVPGGDHPTLLFLGDGVGGLELAADLIPEDPDQDGYVARPCDVDGDGDLDIVEGGRRKIGQLPAEKRPRLLLNQLVSGQPWTLDFIEEDPIEWELPSLYRVVDIACADVNQDSYSDLVLARQQNAKNVLLTNVDGYFFFNASNLLPDLTSGEDGFDYIHEVEWTQGVTVCTLEDAPGQVTLFYGNGDINNKKYQQNVVMRFAPDGHGYSVHEPLGVEFDTVLDLTEEILCEDLDGDGDAETLFFASNAGRDRLFKLAGGTP